MMQFVSGRVRKFKPKEIVTIRYLVREQNLSGAKAG